MKHTARDGKRHPLILPDRPAPHLQQQVCALLEVQPPDKGLLMVVAGSRKG
jgi:hypothetical protein